MTKLQKFILQIVILIVAGQVATVGLAQEIPPWQAAEDIRQHLFNAQTEMFSAARADNPQEHYQAAASLVEQAETLYADTIQVELTNVSAEVDQAITRSFDQAHTAALQGQALKLAAARG